MATMPYIAVVTHGAAGFRTGKAAGVLVFDGDGGSDLRLAPYAELQTGDDQARYGHPAYRFGTLESPLLVTAQPFDRVIPSWIAATPPGTWLEVELRAALPSGGRTAWYSLARWASETSFPSRSVAGQDDEHARIATDTLELRYAAAGSRGVQYRLTLFTTDPRSSPRVRRVRLMTSDSEREPLGLDLASDRAAWGTELPVPCVSQRVDDERARGWCSPTATSMVLGYWGHAVSVPVAAAATYDRTYAGTGNWAFNTAWAGTYGLDAFVTRLGSLVQVERLVTAGVPVIISLAFGKGELTGAPIASTDGHLIVIRGFAASGDVIANDPAGESDGDVRRVYPRDEVELSWLRGSGGAAYLIHPPGHRIPADRFGSW